GLVQRHRQQKLRPFVPHRAPPWRTHRGVRRRSQRDGVLRSPTGTVDPRARRMARRIERNSPFPMKKTLSLLLACTLLACSPQDMQNILNSVPSRTTLSNEDVIAGLKEALQKGTERSVEKAG